MSDILSAALVTRMEAFGRGKRENLPPPRPPGLFRIVAMICMALVFVVALTSTAPQGATMAPVAIASNGF